MIEDPIGGRLECMEGTAEPPGEEGGLVGLGDGEVDLGAPSTLGADLEGFQDELLAIEVGFGHVTPSPLASPAVLYSLSLLHRDFPNP